MSLSMRAITKSFSSNAVLKGVDFALEDGEIRALIGENGAGKTTLMNILGGVLRPDAGVIELDGKRVEFASPRDSLAAGIAFIHQELNLVNDLNVYENLFLGRERVRGAFTDTARMREEARAVLERMGMALDPCAMVRDLDASYKQVVEIARALLFDARVIIMDEPTTSLTEPEIERVFSMMRTVKEQGVSIVFISHKLREVLEICDTYTVLRDGVNVAAGATRETTEAELARHMVGHEVSTRRLAREGGAGEVALEVEGLSQARAFEDVSFSLRAGEILGVTGLLGDGAQRAVPNPVRLSQARRGPCAGVWPGDGAGEHHAGAARGHRLCAARPQGKRHSQGHEHPGERLHRHAARVEPFPFARPQAGAG